MSGYTTFYIDPDDEIPSCAARMKSTGADFLVLVIPQRAVLFSSIITMRLLKKEADRLGKDIFLVTQDESGFDMAKRVGFVVRKTLEELPFAVEKRGGEAPKTIVSDKNVPIRAKSDSLTPPMRSPEYARSFEGGASAPRNLNGARGGNEVTSFNRVSKETSQSPGGIRSVAQALSPETKDLQEASLPRTSSIDKVYTKRTEERDSEDEIGSSIWNDRSNAKKEESQTVARESKEVPAFRREDQSKIPVQKARPMPPIPERPKNTDDSVGSRVQWIVAVSFFVILGMIGGIVFSLQNPEAKVIIHPKSENISGDVNFVASAENSDVATRFLEYDDAIKTSVPATGAASGAGGRSHGTVTFVNAFSVEAQPLVATTRIQSPDGKIFRITKSVMIPGFQQKDGETQPGRVEAEVQADTSGAEYDIPATKFTIPGFSDSTKQEKIYAESQGAMTGGGVSEGKSRSVTQGDIAGAKKRIEQDTKVKVLERAKADMESGMTSEDLIEITFSDETATPSIGTVTETFELNAKIHVRYAVFSENDAKKMAIRSVTAKDDSQKNITVQDQSVKIEYGKMTADFAKKTIDIKLFVSGSLLFEVPTYDIRTDILGKTEAELQPILDNYPQVQGFEIEIQKSYFQKRIPTDPSKVSIEVAS